MRRAVTMPLLVLIGVSYRTASLAGREALALDDESARALLARLVATHGIREAAVLFTCSRSEFYVVADDAATAVTRVRAIVRDTCGSDLVPTSGVVPATDVRRDPGSSDDHRRVQDCGAAVGDSRDLPQHGEDCSAFVQSGADAARHLLRVASGVDSPILGDAQVLGQVKQAYAIACAAGSAGAVLHRLFETALRAGKRTRHETGIGQGSTSTAAAAADLVAHSLAPMGERHVLVVGAGETASLVARHLAKRRPASIVVANRTLAHADALAREIGGRALRLDALREALESVDAVVSATSSPKAVISSEMLADVMHARPARPLLALDLAVPRDIEWQAAAIAGVTLHAIDGVQAEVSRRVAARSAQVPRVHAIVGEELGRFSAWLLTAQAADVIRAIRTRAERARLRALDAWFPDAASVDRVRADRATRLAVNRLLHAPMLRLRAMAGSADGAVQLSALREQLDVRTVDLG